MNYPDGSEIRAGDIVALHYRTYTGTVKYVIESAGDVTASGLVEPGVMIDTSYGGLVFHRAGDLTTDEIALSKRA